MKCLTNTVSAGKIIFLLILCLLISNSCSREKAEIVKIPKDWENNELTKYIEEAQLITHPILGEIDILGPALLLDNNELVVSDIENYNVYLINLDTGEHKQLISFGTGPNEMTYIDSIQRCKQGFTVMGQRNVKNATYLFSFDGEYIEDFGDFDLERDVIVEDDIILGLNRNECNDMTYAFYMLNKNTGKVIRKELDFFDQLVKINKKDFDDDLYMLGMNNHLAKYKNKVIIASFYQGFVYIFDTTEKDGKYYKIEDPFFDDFKLNFRGYIVRRGEWDLNFNDIEIDNAGNIFLPIAIGYEDGDRFRIDIFTPEMERLKILMIKNYPEYISYNNGKLLVVDNFMENCLMLYDIQNL